MDALNKMVESYDIMLQNNSTLTTLQSQVSQLEALVLTQSGIAELQSQIDAINTTLANNAAIFSNNANLLSLIQQNYQEITNIYKNYTSVAMSYNIDLLNSGPGIFVDKTVPGSVKFVNKNQTFTLGTKPLVSIASDFTTNATSYSYIHKLINFTNYLKITDGAASTPYVIDRDVIIYINDANFAWEAGQTMRFSFKYGLDLSNTNGNFNFIVYTDSTDKLNTGFPYSAEAAYVTYLDFENKGNSPIIEVVCIDPATYQFAVDVF
jgi:hypothetical protein